ncbi:MAG: nucleoside triphosphate pyrophosphohydrolase [Firmicutes bacterium HGW-Firmicutes-14]|nr:MAG: nucleoside triphosphate pyrophosphohydrolase [Firmicutes bacterium HGW-Firmicutes-14]
MNRSIIVVGLGPGGMECLSVGTLEILKNACKLFLRTGRHPVAGDLTGMGIKFSTFDYLYERYTNFQEVYFHIACEVTEAAEKGPVVFAVPGHPLVGEEAVAKIINLAGEKGLTYKVMPAMSFLDPVLVAANLDLSPGLKLVDGLQLALDSSRPEYRPDPGVPNVIMQVHNRLVASEIKISLMEFYPDEHVIKVIGNAGIKGMERVETIPLFEMDRLDWIDHLTCIYLPPLQESKTSVSRYPLDTVVDIMGDLRDEDGCPWDREQTHLTLKKYLLEEAYEVLDAIDEGNMYKLCEELGDLLLQITFHAEIARESGFFDMNDVIEVISKKLIRRHPHVFGTTSVRNSAEVSVNWEEIKKKELKEKGEIRQSILDGIPESMPALMRADKIQSKAAKVGFDWPDYRGAMEKVVEELAELKEAVSENDPNRVREETGDLLFAVVNLARLLKVNSEETLLTAVRKFKDRFNYMENKAAQANRDLKTMVLEELDSLWEEAKTELKSKKT